MKRRILVCDGEQRAALAVARSLGRSGYECIVCSTSGRSISGASRYSAYEFSIPSSESHPRSFVTAIAEAISRHRVDLVVPITEASLLALLPGRDAVSARIPFPSAETFRAICDKRAVLDAAQA